MPGTPVLLRSGQCVSSRSSLKFEFEIVKPLGLHLNLRCNDANAEFWHQCSLLSLSLVKMGSFAEPN